MTDVAAGVSTYHCSRAPGLRLVGVALLPFGLLWAVAGFTGFPLWAVILLAADAVVIGGLVLRLLAFPPRLLTLSDDGYRIYGVRGNSRSSAQWSAVDAANTTGVGGSPAVVISLEDGSTSVLPLALLGSQAIRAQREIHDRLDAAHGYRPLEQDLPGMRGNQAE